MSLKRLALANKMGFEYYLVVSYEIILYQHCKFSTNYRSAVIDIAKYGNEAAVDGATIQLYKTFKGTQSPIIPTLVLTVPTILRNGTERNACSVKYLFYGTD